MSRFLHAPRRESEPVYGESFYDPARGIAWAEIENAETPYSNSVELVILPGGRSEVVRICGKVALTISVKSGAGTLRKYDPKTDEYRAIVLGEKGTDHATLFQGDGYFYTNDSHEPLVLHDTSTPKFQEGDEESLEG